MLHYQNRYTIMLMAQVSDSLVEKVAEKLQGDLAGIWSQHPFLPGISKLAPLYGVGAITMLNVCRLLRERGVLDFRRGQKMRRAGWRPERQAQVPSGRERISTLIKEWLTDGVLRTGQVMPKVAYWIAKENVSPHTVLQVYRQLERESLLHKVARQWRAGPDRTSAAGIAISGKAYILLVQHKEQHWKGLMFSERIEKFCQTFQAEADQHNVGLLPVVTGAGQTDDSLSPTGESSIQEVVRQLSGSYLGALIASSPEEMPDLERWVRFLVQLGKPVVWFDRADEANPIDFRSKSFSQCCFTEAAAVREAVSGLALMGHRDICFLRADSKDGWINRRQSLIEAEAARVFPAIRIHREKSLPNPESWRMERKLFANAPATAEERALKRLRDILLQRLDKHPGGTWKWLIRLSPYILPYLLRGAVTAILVSNDETALKVYQWLKAMGLSLPRDVSLVSFDNYARVMHMPIATTDFGMASLGYGAFHLLLGDISIPREENGRLTAKPRLINRGSLGPPRHGPLNWSP